jgi:subtilisin family serine protease
MNRVTVVLLGAAAALMTPPGGAVEAPDRWRDKVDASVLTQAASLSEAGFFIYMTQQADVSGAHALATKREKGRYVYAKLRAAADASQPPVLAQLAALGAEARPYWIVNTIWARGDLAAIEAVASRADVAHIYASGFGQIPTPVPEDSDPGILVAENNLLNVKADQAWALGYKGQGVVVGGADTGVAWEHAALKSKYRGWNGSTADHDYNWFLGADPNPVVCPDDEVPCDDDVLLAGGHGTHTMGTMVGDDGAGNQIGMAPDAQWIACRNLDSGVGHVPAYLNCMEFMLAPTDTAGNNPDPDKAPDVVNNSWGCVEACPPPILKEQLENSTAAGIFYAVSAGNDGPECSTLAFPLAIYEAAFSVGATNHRTDTIASFSSRGPILTDVPNPPRVGPDISAPGVTVRSSVRDGSYDSLSGTSMAGPHVAGLVALVISANPDLRGRVDTIEQIIMDSAVPLFSNEGCGDDTSTSRPNNAFGWGRIDALAAVLRANEDADGDDVADVLDNCTLVANPSQCDTNGDGFGNHCDADLDDNGIVNQIDLGMLRNELGAQGENDADLDCNGVVNQIDLGRLRDALGDPPGPSANGS